jgi:mycothiol synthase
VPDIEVKYQLDRSELASLNRLLSAVSEADDHPALDEHAWLDLVQGGRAGFAGLVARGAGEAEAVGYAQLSREAPPTGQGAGSWALELVVDPGHRGPGSTVTADLLGRALQLVAAEGGGHLHLWVSKPSPSHDRLAAAAGLSPGRALYQMRLALPAEERSELPVRPFVVGQDEQAWLEVNNRAFAWHPEQGGWSLATLQAREAQPWFDPSGFLLHEHGGRLAGFCWTKLHRHGPEDVGSGDVGENGDVGEIYVVAVDPDFTGRGLGRRLVLAGLEHMAAQGLPEAMLYVDATNRRAVKMYVDLGFVVNHIDRAYTGDIAPAGPGCTTS